MSHARWGASALVATGVPAAEITALSCLLTPLTRARTILRHIYHEAGKKPSARGMHVAQVLQIIGKHYLKLPEEALAQLRSWARPVQLTYDGITEKNQICVQKILGDPARELRLRELPGAYMQAARARLRAQRIRKACALAQAAVQINLLIIRALRAGEIRNLRLDHLQRADPGRGRVT
jgi:ribosome biogenesis SPOUT family RNA methylase Rps3